MRLQAIDSLSTVERSRQNLGEIHTAIAEMPETTIIERRDRAVVAFRPLSGMRDNAIASLSLKYVDLARRSVFQDAREVRTKNAKTFTSWFFPVGEGVTSILIDVVADVGSINCFVGAHCG